MNRRAVGDEVAAAHRSNVENADSPALRASSSTQVERGAEARNDKLVAAAPSPRPSPGGRRSQTGARSELAFCARPTIFTTAIWISLCLSLSAADAVRTVKGTVNGTVESMTAQEVKVKRSDGREENIAVNAIRAIKYDGEPPKLDQVRKAAAAGRYDDCLRTLAELDQETIERDEIKVELQYFRALSTGRLALAGASNLREAGKVVRGFVDQHTSSYHYLSACELFGDLLVAVGAHDKAIKEYDKLDAAPWDDFKMRAAIAKGGVLKAQKKYDEAAAAYDRVLELAQVNPGKDDATKELIASQALTATLGKVEALAEAGQIDAAVQMVEKVIADAPPEDAAVLARAYNALGNSLKKAGRTKEALLAYLHVDVLYASQSQAHAEALRNLAELWSAVNQPQRAAQTLQTLQDRYQVQ